MYTYRTSNNIQNQFMFHIPLNFIMFCRELRTNAAELQQLTSTMQTNTQTQTFVLDRSKVTSMQDLNNILRLGTQNVAYVYNQLDTNKSRLHAGLQFPMGINRRKGIVIIDLISQMGIGKSQITAMADDATFATIIMNNYLELIALK